MNKTKKTFSGLMGALFITANIVGAGSIPVKAAFDDMPKLNFVGIEHSPLVVGDTQTFSLTSNYDQDVQYRAFLYSEKSSEWTELTDGYTNPQNPKVPYEIKYEKPFELGKYKLSFWIKRANEIGINSNSNGSYDTYYTASLNCVDKDDSNKVYADGDLNYTLEGLKLNINGIKDIGGIPGPYQYKLHYFDPSTGEWIKNATLEYKENGLAYTFPKAGTYVIDVHVNTNNSKTWTNYEADKTNTKETYEAWKLAVIEAKTDFHPAPNVIIEPGLTDYDRYVEIKLDTISPEDYKVTVLGTELKYDTEKKLFKGVVMSYKEDVIKNGVVVTTK